MGLSHELKKSINWDEAGVIVTALNETNRAGEGGKGWGWGWGGEMQVCVVICEQSHVITQ